MLLSLQDVQVILLMLKQNLESNAYSDPSFVNNSSSVHSIVEKLGRLSGFLFQQLSIKPKNNLI